MNILVLHLHNISIYDFHVDFIFKNKIIIHIIN